MPASKTTTMPGPAEFGAALMLGLLGGGHCLGMCGGLGGALAFSLGPHCSRLRRFALVLLCSAGRVLSYAVIGALAGVAAGAAPAAAGPALRVLAGAMLVAAGLAFAGWPTMNAWLERAAMPLWARMAPLARRIGPPDRPGVALLAGMAWGWLPCGLVYAAVGWSAATAGGMHAALLMGVFGLGTVPAVMASGALGALLQRSLRRPGLRIAAAICVCGFGVWTALAGVGGHGLHAHH